MRPPRFLRSWLGAALVLTAGCGDSDRRVAPITSDEATRVAIVVLEAGINQGVMGPGWLARVAKLGGQATEAYGETHPSLGNYLAMISGSTQGVRSDDVTVGPFAKPTIAGQLTRAGVSWRAYMNGMRRPCYGRTTTSDEYDRYAKRHNPFMFFTEVVGDATYCEEHVVPGEQLARDIAAGTLPRFIWITPDLCQGMHDCPVAAGQRWMARALPPLIKALGPRGVVFVTADESDDDVQAGGHIPLVALGGRVRPGSVVGDRSDHRTLLATVQDLLGVPRFPTTRGRTTLAALIAP